MFRELAPLSSSGRIQIFWNLCVDWLWILKSVVQVLPRLLQNRHVETTEAGNNLHKCISIFREFSNQRLGRGEGIEKRQVDCRCLFITLVEILEFFVSVMLWSCQALWNWHFHSVMKWLLFFRLLLNIVTCVYGCIHLLWGFAGSLKQQKERFNFNTADRSASSYNRHFQMRHLVIALGSMLKSYSIRFVPVFWSRCQAKFRYLKFTLKFITTALVINFSSQIIFVRFLFVYKLVSNSSIEPVEFSAINCYKLVKYS